MKYFGKLYCWLSISSQFYIHKNISSYSLTWVYSQTFYFYIMIEIFQNNWKIILNYKLFISLSKIVIYYWYYIANVSTSIVCNQLTALYCFVLEFSSEFANEEFIYSMNNDIDDFWTEFSTRFLLFQGL